MKIQPIHLVAEQAEGCSPMPMSTVIPRKPMV